LDFANRKIGLIGCLLIGFLLSLAIARLSPRPPLSSYAPSSTAVLAADGSLLRLTLAADQQYRLWASLDSISPKLVEAVKLQEDYWFDWHPGINPYALIRGAWTTYAKGNRQGGSTLTMQLARLIYRLDTRSPLGKIKQIAEALALELRYSKRELLEAYLNLAPFGRNIQGVAAASLIYFGKTPDRLTLPEILTLAIIPQRPNIRAGRDNAIAQDKAGKAARLRLFERWRQTHSLGTADERLMQLPVSLRDLSKLPFLSPHLTDYVLSLTALKGNQDHQIVTTLNPRLQALLERQVGQYIRQNSSRGLHNASAMLVDTRNMGVVALLGSADFHDPAILGQVNGTRAKRSPGSTLKPFIYALGLDQGLIHPLTILKDTPTAFGPFQPENFDSHFVGPLTVRDALIRSRNVPAVMITSQLRQPGLYDFLKNAGISRLQSEQHYGLALALGGGELTMEELVALYAMLANQGILKPLHYLKEKLAVDNEGIRLLSPEASYLTLDMLSTNPRPGGLYADTDTNWTVAWKTGTSWGFRDAWSIGIVGSYVLAVWIGNFDGSPNQSFVGIDAAAPLFFRIADALPLTMSNERIAPRLPPANLKRVSVCSASGDLPNAWCPKTEDTWFIPGKSPIRISTLHRPVTIDNRTGRMACPPYGADTHTEVFEFWSSDMMRLFRETGMPRRAPPVRLCAGSANQDESEPPRLLSPLTGVTYTLRLSRPDETIALQAGTEGDVKNIYWFSDKEFLGTSQANKNGLPWRPAHAGWHSLTAVDDHGRSISREIKVEIVP
jgi:penicillin-binding protein 1C